MARTYELRQRAENVTATRKRIVEATVELHTSLGPARTTLIAIAERAGVQRLTVKRHLPDAPPEPPPSLGPARTTISAMAGRPGVQPLTVYRHFPDERALFQACSGHW